MKVLVTGASGFIGNAVAHRLVDQGHKVRCLVRQTSNTQALSDIVWDKAIGDITSVNDCREAVRGMEAVIHCAAHVTDYGSWKSFQKINVEGSQNIAEAALGNKVDRFVYLSTSDVLGLRNRVMDDSMSPKKSGFPYPDTKIEAEELLFDLFRKRGLPLVALRPAWVYGPGDRTFFPELVDAMKQGFMVYFGDKRNFLVTTYIDNLVDAMMLALEKPDAIGRAYLVTDGVEMTWEDLCTRLADELKLKSPLVTIPNFLSKPLAFGLETTWKLTFSKNRPLLTRYSVAFMGSNLRYDDKRIRNELGYQPEILPEEGIRRTIEWLKSQPIGSLKIK